MTVAEQDVVRLQAPGAAISPLRWEGAALSSELVWSALTRTFAAESRQFLHDHVKLFVDGERVLDRAVWPTDASGQATWRASLAEDDREPAVFAFARGVQRCQPELLRVIAELVGDHVGTVGLARGRIEAEVFYGAYRNTPGGIHREGCTNMHLVLEGCKSMHFWRGAAWIPPGTVVRADIDPEEHHPEEYLPELAVSEVEAHGSVITAGPGEGYFWRSGVWHVGVTHETSLALNIASYTKTLDEVAGPFLPWAPRVEGAVPASWLADYARYSGAPLDVEGLMARLSGFGMRTGWEPAPPAPAPTHVERVSRAPLVWAPTFDGDLAVGALGFAWRVPATRRTQEWLERLGRVGAVAPVPPEVSSLATALCTSQLMKEMT